MFSLLHKKLHLEGSSKILNQYRRLGNTTKLCVQEQDLQTQVLFSSVHALCPDLVITAVLGLRGMYDHSRGQRSWLRTEIRCTIAHL